MSPEAYHKNLIWLTQKNLIFTPKNQYWVINNKFNFEQNKSYPSSIQLSMIYHTFIQLKTTENMQQNYARIIKLFAYIKKLTDTRSDFINIEIMRFDNATVEVPGNKSMKIYRFFLIPCYIWLFYHIIF